MKIILNDVSKNYHENEKSHQVFSNINLTINQSSSYAIVGNSGIGKSTLLYLLGGLDKASLGSISLVPEEGDNPYQRNFSYIFQDHNLLQELSVLENLILPLIIANTSWKNAKRKVLNILEELSMDNLKDHYLHQLSGGQRQRVAVVRAVAQDVNFILADEPSANLDEENTKLVVELLLKVRKQFGVGLIVCSHDPKVYSKMEHIIRISNKKAIMEN